MEPKPRGINPDNVNLTALPWLAKAIQEYKASTDFNNKETTFFRGNGSIEVLDKILPQIPSKPNILLIGLGLDGEPIMCCYEPFRIAAHLQGKGVDYTMTLVDIDKEVIEDVRGRSKLFLSYRQYDKRLAGSFEKAWSKYLQDTKQPGSEIYELQDGLQFCSYLENDNDWGSTYRNYLKRGIAVADVPLQFRTKLSTGEVVLVHDDIAVADIRGTKPYDFVELTNVLYLMTKQGQQLALANVSNSMARGSRLLINDIGGYVGQPVFTRLGGWLDDKKMGQLGLGIEEVISSKETSQTVLLRKNLKIVNN